MSKEIVLIDTDPGVDDAYALLYSFVDDVDIRLICSVSGNVNIDYTTDNTQRIVALAKQNIKIVKGSSTPLVKEPVYASYVHGVNGMNDYKYLDDNKAKLSNDNFIEAYYQTIMQAEKPVVIVAVGPLTNIALLFKVYPEVIEKIKYISIMGGGIKGGNITVAGEFNFYVDPEAASIVFNSGVDIILAPLDVTEKTNVKRELIEEISKLNYVGKFLADVLKADSKYMQADQGSLHDVVSVMAINNLHIFKYKMLDGYVDVSDGLLRGMTVFDQRQNAKAGKIKVLYDVDVDKFNQELVNKIKKYSAD